MTMEEILYICSVKSVGRHKVAAQCSVFCERILSVYYNRIECGSRNAHDVLAQLNVTARNAVSFMSLNELGMWSL